jgi:NAD+ kinase
MSTFPTVGIIVKRNEPGVSKTLQALCPLLHDFGAQVLVEAGEHVPAGLPARTVSRKELADSVQLAVVIGGDGTMLHAGRTLAPKGVPLLGINQGRLGFMTDVRPEAMHEALAAVLRGEYEIDDRMMLSAQVRRSNGEVSGPFIAVNDVVVRNQATIRMLEFETWLNGDFISLHRADGMIVSSPTGSTAYALSGGGPLLHPSLSAIALVPICPHTLSDRPIVVGAGAGQEIRLLLRGVERTLAMATFDGQSNESLLPGDAVGVACAPFPLRLIHPRGYDYFAILRNKLRWGRGPETTPQRA